jgi:hypothetical protein
MPAMMRPAGKSRAETFSTEKETHMFIASAHLDTGDHLLVLGLSAENRRRLADGRPIDLSRVTHGMAIPAGLRIMIFAGETEESMGHQMADLIGPTTVVDQKRPQ